MPPTSTIRDAIAVVPEAVWTPAIDPTGEVREGGDVAELTGLLDLTGWPPGMRVLLRRERPHPGAQLSLLEEADGWRYQAVATNTTVGQLAFLEARHRAHARVEDRIRHAKELRTGPLPVPGVQDQPDMDHGRRDQRGPDRLASAARTDR